jgi:hypothetical protein
MSEHLHYIPIPEIPPSKVQKFLGKTLLFVLEERERVGASPKRRGSPLEQRFLADFET